MIKNIGSTVKIGNIKNLLLRGCFVKNTDYGIGIVVYTGMETKIMKNMKKAPHKVSNVMKLMNRMLYTVFIFQLIIICVFAGLSNKWTSSNQSSTSYLEMVHSYAITYFSQHQMWMQSLTLSSYSLSGLPTHT